MDKLILRDAEMYASAHRRKRRWYQVMTCLAAVVVFCTTYALILPAITLEKQCQIPEHIHTEACYTQVTSREKRALACEVEADVVVHEHDAACWDENGNLVCSLPEIEIHRHTDSCYTIPEVHAHGEACHTLERGALTCTQSTEPQHIHTEDCYQESSDLVCGTPESTGHAHGAECFDDDGNLICGQEESQGHAHGEGCYEVSRQLICGQTEEPAHQHTDECYSWNQVLTCEKSTEAAQPVLTCEKDEIELHTHQPFVSEEDTGCYDADGENLVCGKPQVVEHRHTEACFETVEEPVDIEALTCTLPEDETHTHTAQCYGTWELACGMEEHTHSEACTPTEEAVFCGIEPHTHDTGCWDETGNLICTLEEHTHSLTCYSDSTADVETENDWKQSFGDVTLTGNWRQDAVMIAKTQLGYTESTANYIVEDDGQTPRGYTRYGAWYGDPYGDWDAMFVSFCLHYAGAEDIPMDKDCGSWVTALADAFVPAQSHEAAPGELVFFDRDGDGTADHVALVSEVTAGEDGATSGFTAIAGDVDNAVQQLSYAAGDSMILGYGSLPEQAKEFTLTAQTETGITVTISGDSASLPCLVSEITVTAAEVVDEESQAIRDQLLEEEDTEPEQRFLLDITLWHDGEEIEPTGPVTVTFSGFDTEGLYPKVYHIDTEANEATDMDAVKDEAGDITVSTDHFSVYEVQLLSAPEGTGISGESITQIANGGKFYLTGTAYTSSSITITKDTTLDLNGNGIYYKGTSNFLVINSGATLTIKDSNPATASESNGSGNLYGNAASLTFESNGNKPVKLTYYVTQSSASGTGTSETLKKYEVTPTGCIVGEADGGAASIVKVNSGGTCNLEGGLLTIRYSSSYSGDAHIISNSGTLNLKGGYVTGGSDSCWGGGIYSGSGSAIYMTGGVIAANYGTNGGGICIDSGTFTMSGGVISGNGTHRGSAVKDSQSGGLGGGVYANNATITISGGYLTNNSEYGKCELNGAGCHGGGGIATIDGELTMTGGYITGNSSQEAGGGLYVGHFDASGTGFSMTGGTVAGNVALNSEGGGIRISGGTTGVINASGSKVYITNNSTNSTYDWGGGGIFVQKNGTLNIYNSLITSNSAGGFGGGVGACPTGETLIVHNDGAAIYNNSASGDHMSSGGDGKNYDSTVANESTVFKSNGYQDYFCVRASDSSSYISLVTGEMVGGGAANWQGSCDNSPITISKTGHAAAKYLFGLTARPDSNAISSAQAVAGVVISGNSAYTHGGGIMTNGGLILGNTEGDVVTATPSLDISGTKTLLKDGAAQSSGLDYRFQLTNSSGEVVGTATADSSTGAFTISPNTEYEQTGTYTYYLTEVNDGRSGVTYDGSKYQIDVTIGEKSITLLGVTFKSYYVQSVNVTKTGGSQPTNPDDESTHPDTFRVHFQNTKGWSNVGIYVWGDGEIGKVADWPGKAMTQSEDGYYTADFTVSGRGTFNCIFNDGTGGTVEGTNKTKDLKGITYEKGKDVWISFDTITANTADDSTDSGVSFTGTANSDESYSLTINGSAFTNTKQTSLNLQLIKTDSNDASKRLEGAMFLLKQAGAETGMEATTDSNGIATFAGISRNTTYYLYETTPPTNYMTAGPWILVVEENTATLYPATEKEDGTLTKNSGETGTTLSVSGSDPIVFSATISDQPWGYELPNTGGAGTQLYTMGGLLLMAAAGFILLYSHTKRRKEDAESS